MVLSRAKNFIYTYCASLSLSRHRKKQYDIDTIRPEHYVISYKTETSQKSINSKNQWHGHFKVNGEDNFI